MCRTLFVLGEPWCRSRGPDGKHRALPGESPFESTPLTLFEHEKAPLSGACSSGMRVLSTFRVDALDIDSRISPGLPRRAELVDVLRVDPDSPCRRRGVEPLARICADDSHDLPSVHILLLAVSRNPVSRVSSVTGGLVRRVSREALSLQLLPRSNRQRSKRRGQRLSCSGCRRPDRPHVLSGESDGVNVSSHQTLLPVVFRLSERNHRRSCASELSRFSGRSLSCSFCSLHVIKGSI